MKIKLKNNNTQSSSPHKRQSPNPKKQLSPNKSRAGNPKNRLYLDSGASVHILFNRELMGDMTLLDTPLNISGAGLNIKLHEAESLHEALRHLPLPR